MVEAHETRGPLPRTWTLATLAALGLVSVGCTMCPDPFDYSGPVPNGSSPQNDFRARSNGILPLGAASKPWPLLVKDGARGAASPQESEPTPTLAEEAEADHTDAGDVEQTVAVLGESEGETVEDGESQVAGDASSGPQLDLEPVPVTGNPTEPPSDTVKAAENDAGVRPAAAEEVRPLPAAPVVPMTPPVQTGETPGWRARRR